MSRDLVIISDYRWTAIVKSILFYVLAIGLGIPFISHTIISLSLFFLWVIILFAKLWYDNPIKRIIVSPTDLTIEYLTSKEETISYLNIKAIRSKRAKGRDMVTLTRIQEIEFFDNDNIIFYNEDDFSNFDQLKNSIWTYRLNALQALRESEALNDAL